MISICIKDNNPNIQSFLSEKLNNCNIPDIYYSKHDFKNYLNTIVHYKGNDIDTFYHFLSNALSDSIVYFYKPRILKRLISSEYFYFDEKDKLSILNEFSLIKSDLGNYLISDSVFNYIREHKCIVLDGFVNFRIKDYTDYIDEVLESAVSKFVMDKEYLEFVSLLKFYVDSKIPEPITVNLIYVNKESILLDDDNNIIPLEDFDSEYLSDISFSQNDYALNTLVGKIPQRINIHLISPKDEFIDTIELIFKDRVHICSGNHHCEICSTYKLLNLK